MASPLLITNFTIKQRVLEISQDHNGKNIETLRFSDSDLNIDIVVSSVQFSPPCKQMQPFFRDLKESILMNLELIGNSTDLILKFAIFSDLR